MIRRGPRTSPTIDRAQWNRIGASAPLGVGDKRAVDAESSKVDSCT